MNRERSLRIFYILLLIVGTGFASWLIIRSLEANISLYYTPTDVHNGKVIKGPRMRFGGLVKAQSVKRLSHLMVEFTITDGQADLQVRYKGVLPDLFKEEQGVVATGYLDPNGLLVADEILAKHDEKYMPPKIAPLQAP